MNPKPGIQVDEESLKRKPLGDVLRQSQVPVSSRMVDDGLNGEIQTTQRHLSEESIPRSLKSVLSRNSSADKIPADVKTGDEFTENTKDYMFADRAKQDQ